MLSFDEQKDQIDTFLATFEKIAKANKVLHELWAVNLSVCYRVTQKMNTTG